ncbi:MAG: hypothetical protein M1522_07125 [Actinobacteria bacterium]|nr:hypothetical protein [Actinomycetota bacterium]
MFAPEREAVRRVRLHPHARVREDGMGLVEVLVAVTLLLMVLVPSAMLLTNTVNLTSELAMRTTGSQLASAQIACVRAQPLASLGSEVSACANSTQDVPATATYTKLVGVAGSGQIPYSITQVTSWALTNSGGGTSYTCLAVKVTVNWPANGSSQSLTRSSLGGCEPTPQLNWSPGSLGFPGWNSVLGLYFDASPGNTSPTRTVTLSVQPPQVQSESYDYVAIGTIAFAGTAASDYRIVGDTCSGTTIYSPASNGPTPTGCTVTVGLDPPGNATPGVADATLEIPDNASGAPQQIPLEGYVSPDLFVVQ